MLSKLLTLAGSLPAVPVPGSPTAQADGDLATRLPAVTVERVIAAALADADLAEVADLADLQGFFAGAADFAIESAEAPHFQGDGFTSL